MVEITLTILLQIVQTVGILVGVYYYIMSLQNQSRTRQAQLFMQLFQDFISAEMNKIHLDLVKMEWEDYHDFEMKYGSDYNLDSAAKRLGHLQWFNGVGLLLKQNLINMDLVYPTVGEGAMEIWTKFESTIREQRVRYSIPEWNVWFEYLVDEVRKIRRIKGLPTEPKETFGSYVPDK